MIGGPSSKLYCGVCRFVQFHVMIGGPSSKLFCGVPESEHESLFVQYSTDGGKYYSVLNPVGIMLKTTSIIIMLAIR